MPSYSEYLPASYYQELARKRHAYEKKLIAKGVKPRSSKMLELMCRKFR